MKLLTLTADQRTAVVCALVDGNTAQATALLQQYHRRATLKQLTQTLAEIRGSLMFGTVRPPSRAPVSAEDRAKFNRALKGF